MAFRVKNKKVPCDSKGLIPTHITEKSELVSRGKQGITGSYGRGVCPKCKSVVSLDKHDKVAQHNIAGAVDSICMMEIPVDLYSKIIIAAQLAHVTPDEYVIECLKAVTGKTLSNG